MMCEKDIALRSAQGRGEERMKDIVKEQSRECGLVCAALHSPTSSPIITHRHR